MLGSWTVERDSILGSNNVSFFRFSVLQSAYILVETCTPIFNGKAFFSHRSWMPLELWRQWNDPAVHPVRKLVICVGKCKESRSQVVQCGHDIADANFRNTRPTNNERDTVGDQSPFEHVAGMPLLDIFLDIRCFPGHRTVLTKMITEKAKLASSSVHEER